MSDPMLPLPGLSLVCGKKVVVDFDGGLLSSDGGVLALREIEQRLRVAERMAACLKDPRAPEQITHSLADIIRFRLLMIVAGYEDGNDADALRCDLSRYVARNFRQTRKRRHYPRAQETAFHARLGSRRPRYARGSSSLRRCKRGAGLKLGVTMPRTLPPFVEMWHDRHEKMRAYFRKGKGARISLPTDIRSDEFQEAYAAALAGAVAARARSRAA